MTRRRTSRASLERPPSCTELPGTKRQDAFCRRRSAFTFATDAAGVATIRGGQGNCDPDDLIALSKCIRGTRLAAPYSAGYTLRSKCVQHGDTRRTSFCDRGSGLKIGDGTGTRATAGNGPKAPPHTNLKSGKCVQPHTRSVSRTDVSAGSDKWRKRGRRCLDMHGGELYESEGRTRGSTLRGGTTAPARNRNTRGFDERPSSVEEWNPRGSVMLSSMTSNTASAWGWDTEREDGSTVHKDRLVRRGAATIARERSVDGT
uniref:Heme peroxidase n=1 Tax=Ganoderma boninense TaxID=34458 RepID=A0A5K1K7R4_9APHY|nr:Heme peroxidase [Ganoderma boninense]